MKKKIPLNQSKLVLQIPISIVQSNGKNAIQLKKIIGDEENVKWFIQNCLQKEAVEAKIVFLDKFKAKMRLTELGYQVE